MTVLVPEILDATAGRARRSGPWRGAAWRWSLLAGLGLHGVLFATWWSSSQRAEPVVQRLPMQVRVAVQGAAAQPGRSSMAPTSPPLASPLAPTPVPVPSRAQVAATRPQAAPALAPTPIPLPSTVPVERPVTVAKAPTALAAAPEPRPAPPATSVTTGGATTPAQAPTGATVAAHPVAAEPADGAGREDAPVEVSISSVAYLVKPVLTFPPGSEDLGEFGSVTLRVLVDDKGGVSTVQRIKSSGYARLDQQAAKVIRRARFQPHQVNGVPRAMWVTIPVNFNPP